MQGARIAKLLPGGPAEKSGQVLAGDLLVQIDRVTLRGLVTSQISALVQVIDT